ncbi:FtsW/RodA/SpoVE family cell cycle protein, partial [Erysipelatoclostridium ramosum]|nr:FtsW/RodA/SpoVE family cell cycle protein [Thomasclavelia ramosa]
KQLFFIIVSYALMTFFANNFTMKRAQKLFPIFGIGIIIALFSTQLFQDVLGSKAWIRIPIPGLGEMTIQPS